MATSPGRIVVISDTHLGKPRGGAGSADALRPLWRGAERLIINGDVAEVHDITLRTEAARQVVRIQQLCDEDGVELILLSGNHDPLISDLRSLELNDGEVYLTHGDGLHPAISPWAGHRDRLRVLNERTHGSLRPDEAESAQGHLAAAQYASLFTWDEMSRQHEPHATGWRKRLGQAMKLCRVLWYWNTLPHAAVRFAKRHAPSARFFIFGHIHRAGIWRRRDRVVINTGAYGFPFNPRAVIIENHELSVWPIIKDADRVTFRFADKPIARFPLHGRAAA